MATRKTTGGAMIVPPRTQPKNDYPTRDGKPMAESDLHRDLIAELIQTLKWWFRDRPAVYVSGNLIVCYEKGNKRIHVAPDVFVVPGIGNHRRENYLLWEEGRGLDFVIETTSRTTMMEDIETKYNLYVEKLAVREYVMFDPREEYLKPSFQMYRRFGAGFRRVKPTDGRFTSRVLGLELERHGTDLRFRDPATGELLPTSTELAKAEAERADAEARRAEAEAGRADTAEAEVARLRRELARLRGERNGG